MKNAIYPHLANRFFFNFHAISTRFLSYGVNTFRNKKNSHILVIFHRI